MPDWEPPACASSSVRGEELVDDWHDNRQYAGPGPSCSKTGCKNCGDWSHGPGPKQNCTACLPPAKSQTPRVMTDDGLEATTPRYSVAFVLTDDQDLTLGSLEYMPKTRRLLGSEGVTFTNMFATTPVCCPSRSSYMSGLHQHNTGCLANSVGAGCDGPVARGWEAEAMAVHMQRAGYLTGFWVHEATSLRRLKKLKWADVALQGKYLNTYGQDAAGRGLAVPPGWTEWGGLVGNSRYYNFNMSRNGKVEEHGGNYSKDCERQDVTESRL